MTLAHLLTPVEFGLAGMALVFTAVAGIFTDVALGPALVQRVEIDELDRSTAFWTSLAAGLVLTALGVAISPLVAHFFSRPAVGPLFAAASSLFLLTSLSVTQSALLTRELNFRSLELRTMLSALAGAGAAVALALAGAGAWTIVLQAVVAAAVSTALLWRLSPWRPRFVYSRARLRTLGSFGAKTTASQFLDYLHLYGDNLLVGRFLGSRALGVYSVAYNAMFLPLMRISRPISQVAFAAFAKLQDDREQLREGWLRGNRVAAAATAPLFLGLAVVAPDFVPVVLGPRWDGAIRVLQVLCLAGLMGAFQTLNFSCVQATGRADVMLKLRLVTTPLILVAFAVGLRWGIVGVAALFAVARALGLALNTVVTCRVLGCPVARAVRRQGGVAVLAVAMAAAVEAARRELVSVAVPPAFRLLGLVAVGGVVYVVLVRSFAPDLAREARFVFPWRDGRRPSRHGHARGVSIAARLALIESRLDQFEAALGRLARPKAVVAEPLPVATEPAWLVSPGSSAAGERRQAMEGDAVPAAEPASQARRYAPLAALVVLAATTRFLWSGPRAPRRG